MLRYQRMEDGPDHSVGLPANLAMPDAYVTARHLRYLQNSALLQQPLAWSKEPGHLPRVPLGLHGGRGWDRLGEDALAGFIQDRDADVRFNAITERTRCGYRPGKMVEPEQGTLILVLIFLAQALLARRGI